MGEQVYTSEFFDDHRASSLLSARHIIPIVIQLIGPRSVVDVGCGVGTWLSVFAEHGVTDLVGIDGDYVDRSKLLIPSDRFVACDLVEPFELERSFDLVMSLEVAEHLPAESAPTFVRSLSRLAPVVMFSAAVPGQGGVHHLNEQWPDYWADLFAKHRYTAVDLLRPRIWQTPEVRWWYAQNTLLFLSSTALSARPRLRSHEEADTSVMAVVHPRMYAGARRAAEELTARQLLGMLPRALVRSFTWRLSRTR